ncbi:MAG: bifunctional methylenetetrahydrofolate dehydrogenase/methenyltetrahydrofolate cyclohydrolase FolD [Rickettsiales bacterium]
MTAALIDGKAFAQTVRAQVAEGVKKLKQSHQLTPGLAVVLVGDNPASQVYVRNKKKACEEVGIASFDHDMPASASRDELIAKVKELNADPRVHGILVQLPLPRPEDEAIIIQSIAPEKDADGFHVINAGKLATGDMTGTVACTPLGAIMLLKHFSGELKGKHAVVLGRSNIVGKPMAQLLLREDCTVTIAHSKTKNIENVCREADILVAAVGRPQMVKKEWVKPGAIIIDVGINRISVDGKDKLVGDVDFDQVKEVAGAITPVPGGVGPMTIACLLHNTLRAAAQSVNADL